MFLVVGVCVCACVCACMLTCMHMDVGVYPCVLCKVCAHKYACGGVQTLTLHPCLQANFSSKLWQHLATKLQKPGKAKL